MSHFTVPRHIVTGRHALQEAAPLLQQYGKKAMIVTGKHVGRSPMYECLTKILKQEQLTFCTYDQITGEPTDQMIETGVALYQKEHCDFCIGFGGGSPLDAAKAITCIAALGGEIADYNGKEIIGDLPGIVAIPTTAGTGSEATKFTVITDTKRDIKMLLKGDCLLPDLAIIEPDFTMDMPKSVTAATGLDAFTHAVEAYTSKKAGPMTDTLAISAVKRIMQYLPIAYQNGYDGQAREEMSLAALEAGICIHNSSVTLVHGMSRPIGALFHVPHGISNAMLLKDCIRFALPGTYARFANLGRAVKAASENDTDQAAAEKFLDAIEWLCKTCEVPTLHAYGIEEEAFSAVIEKMAEDAIASGSPGNTRREVTKADCIAIYRQAYGDL